MSLIKKIYCFTNIAPHYRTTLWKQLLNEPSYEFHFIFGESPNSGIQSIELQTDEFKKHHGRFKKIKNIWIKRRVLIWQFGVINKCLKDKFDVAIFLGEMYCLSTWIATIICRVRKIEVVFWGHGIYGNEGKIKLFIRTSFYHTAHKHLLYERRAKQLMEKEGFDKKKLYVVFNSLDYENHKQLRQKYQNLNKSEAFTFFKIPERPVLIFIGRLTISKKLNMLLHAVNKINQQHPHVNLLIIGDGKVKRNLMLLGEKGLKNGWLYFTGACYNEEEIGRYLLASDLCVSPGNIGLTAIHSLSFGTPVCTHSNLNNQGPEAGAIIEDYNGCLFEENNKIDLINTIQNWIANHQDREKVRLQCYEVVDKYYNPYSQLNVFNKLLKDLDPDK